VKRCISLISPVRDNTFFSPAAAYHVQRSKGITQQGGDMLIFRTLWNNHPNVKGDTPILDKKVYANQCAINLSAALLRSNIPLTGFRGAKSWQKDTPKYAIRAQELADWLHGTFPKFPRRFEKVPAQDFTKILSQKQGIIFFQNYWGPGNQGDHIDLWNGSRLTDVLSLARIYARFGSLGLGTDYRRAESIWFWGIS
jgi:hypothetical protein